MMLAVKLREIKHVVGSIHERVVRKLKRHEGSQKGTREGQRSWKVDGHLTSINVPSSLTKTDQGGWRLLALELRLIEIVDWCLRAKGTQLLVARRVGLQ